MNRGVAVASLVLVGAVIAIVAWFPGHEDVSESRVLRAPLSASVGTEGGSWYCAARDVGAGDTPIKHTVFLSAPGESTAEVRLDGFSESDRVGSVQVSVEPDTTTAVDVGSQLGAPALSVMAESDAPLVVEHRISFDGGADQAPCSTFSSDRWYFPVVVTTRDATARLNLFNPFPGDASVDIEAALETGVRAPEELSGIVVPSGTTKVVELEKYLERHEQFALTVQNRSGGVVAELAQRFDGSNEKRPVEGLRLVPGSRTTALRWSFAGGFADPGASELLVMMNPSDSEVDATAQLIPFGGVEVMPEPFHSAVPARRYAMIDLAEDPRVPASSFHAIDLEVSGRRSIVAGRSIDVTAESTDKDVSALRATATAGTAASAGVSVSARDWLAGGLAVSGSVDGTVFVHNPGSRPTEVAVVAILDGGAGEPVEYELPPGESVAVDLSSLGAAEDSFAAEVHASAPVVVERLLVFPRIPDISLQPAVPVLGSLEDLVAIGAS